MPGARVFFLLLALQAPLPAQRLLLIDIDDVGQDLLEATPTPFLDRIARAGTVLENFYAAPLCSPTRVRMQLGARTSHPAVLMGGLIECDSPLTMPLDPLVPLGELLSRNGVSNVKIGKWHVGGPDLLAPNKAGWQHYSGVLNNLNACMSKDYFDFRRVTNGQVEHITGEYLTEVETDDAIAALQAGTQVVSVSYHAVHVPLHVPPPHLLFGGVPDTDARKKRSMLRALDHEVGRLVTAGLSAGCTVLIFSDNGTVGPGVAKGTVYEAGVNVPFLAIGPGVVHGVTSPALYAIEDVYATVAEVFGIPTGPNEGPDSVSFLDELTSPDGLGRRWNFSERWKPLGDDPRLGVRWRRGIRDGRYKLVRDQTSKGEEQFFDLFDDPAETEDLLGGPLDPGQQAAFDALADVLDRL